MKYTGPLDQKKMSLRARRGYQVWAEQRQRVGNLYTSRDFLGWYLSEWKRLKPKGRMDVSRKDHDKPYSFDNIELQPVAENMRERNERRGNPCATHRKVLATTPEGTRVFTTMLEAANFYGLDRKTVYNHCHRRTKCPGVHFNSVGVIFQWHS